MSEPLLAVVSTHIVMATGLLINTLTNCVAVRNACTTPPANAAQFKPPSTDVNQ